MTSRHEEEKHKCTHKKCMDFVLKIFFCSAVNRTLAVFRLLVCCQLGWPGSVFVFVAADIWNVINF